MTASGKEGTTLVDAVTALIDWAGVHHDEICQSRSGFDETAAEG